MFLLVLFNLIAAFSTSWKMFAAIRFFIGIACGCYLSVFFILMAEFMPKKYRSLVMAIPAWPFWAAARLPLFYLQTFIKVERTR
jgi:OCT family organic cation transporter-like MFS transporter 4/5